MAPPAPAGTMAAFAFTRPSREFSVEASGSDWPLGYASIQPRVPKGTTVTLMENAAALAGMPHPLFETTKSRAVLAGSAGPPNAPLGLRVSTKRHGVTATNRKAGLF